MKKAQDIKHKAFSSRDRKQVLTLNRVRKYLINRLQTTELDCPFELKEFNNVLVIICPFPLRHNFVAQVHDDGVVVCKHINQFPDRRLDEETTQTDNIEGIDHCLSQYFINVKELITKYL